MSENEFYAYGKNRASIEAVMRFHAVKRWHMIDTTRQQTLAEHSANVALLAYHIALHAPLMIFGGALAVSGMALLHDIDEVFTGDIPTHTKQHLIGLQELEDQNTPQDFRWFPPDKDQKLMIKMCDLADGIRFVRLHGVDVTARHAQGGLEAQFDKKIEQADKQWPIEVRNLVISTCKFYAYEFS